MSATIIPFPRRRPLEDHELPAHWGSYERSYYLHSTYDSHCSHEDAFAFCEDYASTLRGQGESESDFSLRQAMVGVRHLKRRH